MERAGSRKKKEDDAEKKGEGGEERGWGLGNVMRVDVMN